MEEIKIEEVVNESMENGLEENSGSMIEVGNYFESLENAYKDGVVKGAIIGGSVGLAIGTAGLGLWIKERRENKNLFKVLEKVNEIAVAIDQMDTNDKATTLLKYNKEEIDLTLKTMKNPTHIQVELSELIDKMKWVSKGKKTKWNDELKKLIKMSALYKSKQINDGIKDGVNATETMKENE